MLTELALHRLQLNVLGCRLLLVAELQLYDLSLELGHLLPMVNCLLRRIVEGARPVRGNGALHLLHLVDMLLELHFHGRLVAFLELSELSLVVHLHLFDDVVVFAACHQVLLYVVGELRDLLSQLGDCLVLLLKLCLQLSIVYLRLILEGFDLPLKLLALIGKSLHDL